MEDVTIWTASACWGNPGPGGYAFLTVLPHGSHIGKQNGRRKTTRHRMEMFAAIRALTLLDEPCNVTIKTIDIQLFHAINARDFRESPDLETHIMPLLLKHNVSVKINRDLQASWYEDAQARALKESQGHPSKPDTGYDKQKAAQAQQRYQTRHVHHMNRYPATRPGPAGTPR